LPWRRRKEGTAGGPAAVDTRRITNANKEPQNWMTYGRTYDEQRYSLLKQINEKNASQLGLAWFYDQNTLRGIEGTPAVVDGVMYATSAWSIAFALDAKTRQGAVALRPQSPAGVESLRVLRCRQPRARGV